MYGLLAVCVIFPGSVDVDGLAMLPVSDRESFWRSPCAYCLYLVISVTVITFWFKLCMFWGSCKIIKGYCNLLTLVASLDVVWVGVGRSSFFVPYSSGFA